MTKKNRLKRSWSREKNAVLWMVKGVYFNFGQPIKYCMKPKQVMKYLRDEDLGKV